MAAWSVRPGQDLPASLASFFVMRSRRWRVIGMPKWIPVLFAGAVAIAQVQPESKLRVNRDTYSPVMEALKTSSRRATNEQLDKIRELPVEAVWSALDHLGYTNANVTGMRSTQPGTKLVGRALTIQYLPRRPDLDSAMDTLAKEGDWPAAWHVRAGEDARPGDVVVVDLGGELDDGVFWGDVSATSAKAHGARGAVLYGSTRDLTHLRDTVKDFPVLAL